MTTKTEAKRQADYDRFVAELTKLTRKFGVALKSIGGVYIADETDELSNINYVADIGSGDLYPDFQD